MTTLPRQWTYAGFVSDGPGGNMVLVGQSLTDRGSLTTIVWDGTHWTNLSVPGPPARMEPAMGYDPISKRVIMFGGRSQANNSASAPMLSDTWAWDRSIWRQVDTSHTPPPMWEPALIFDSWARRLVLIGASYDMLRPDGGVVLRREESWAWDGNDWKDITPAVTPPPRFRPVVGYDFATRSFVLQGGFTDRNPELVDTWTWAGSEWRMVATNQGPTHRQHLHVAITDPISGGLLAFVSPDQTWLRSSGRWSLQNSEPSLSGYSVEIGLSPSGKELLAVSVDWGGMALWSWDGSRWKLLAPLDLSTWRTYKSSLGYVIAAPPYWYVMPYTSTDVPDNPLISNRNVGSPMGMGSGGAMIVASISSTSPCPPKPGGSSTTLGGLPATRTTLDREGLDGAYGYRVMATRGAGCVTLTLFCSSIETRDPLGSVFDEVTARFRFTGAARSV
jgi:hypothetical protein